MRAQAKEPLLFAFVVLLVPVIGAAQSLPCGECYDRIQQEPASVYELLPGGDDPHKPAPVTAVPLTIPFDEFNVGKTLRSLRDMAPTQGVRTLYLVDGRRAVRSTDPTLCPGAVVGSLTETFGGVEWRITGCASTSEEGALAELRFEEAQPSDRAPRHFLYVRSANGDYRRWSGRASPRIADTGDSSDGQRADAELDALRALTPADFQALEQRLLNGDRSE